MNTIPSQACALSTQQAVTGKTAMRELSLQECTAVSGGLPHLLLLGAGIAAFGIGVVADNYFDGPMAGWYYRAFN